MIPKRINWLATFKEYNFWKLSLKINDGCQKFSQRLI